VRARILYEASALCNDITQNRVLVFFLLSEAQRRGLPGNTTQDAAENDVYAIGYDVLNPIPIPANNASAITVKLYDINTTNQRDVLKALANFTRKTITTLASDDISLLRDPGFGMMNVVLRDMFAHMENNKYGVLNQSDFNLIFERLETVKSPTQNYSVLAELHRDLHSLLARAGQISTEYNKIKYLADALKHDPAGLSQLPRNSGSPL
jgi:hypothetical protein